MQTFIDLLKYILIGIIQGITEILPISSSGHTVLLSNWLNVDTNLPVLIMLVHFGSFISIFFFFRKDIAQLVGGTVKYLVKNDAMYKDDAVYAMKIILSCIPIGIVGFFLRGQLTENVLVVGISLIVTAAALIFVFYSHKNEWTDHITWKNAIIIGAIHTFGVLPGISRSATVLVSGIKQGITVKKVVRFSFMGYILLAIPMLLLGIYDALSNPEPIYFLGYAVAFIFSLVFSYLGIRFLYNYLKVKYFLYFGIYCFILGIVAIITFVI